MALFALFSVLRGFPVAAYSTYAFLSRFAGTTNPCAAPAKICGISPLIFIRCAQLVQDKKLLISELDTSIIYFNIVDGHEL